MASLLSQTAAAAAFSPIALFECTISNAQMLLESMELADLVTALRIVSQLHGRVVDCVEPTAGRVMQLAELYARHAAQLHRLDAAAEAATDLADAEAADAAGLQADVNHSDCESAAAAATNGVVLHKADAVKVEAVEVERTPSSAAPANNSRRSRPSGAARRRSVVSTVARVGGGVRKSGGSARQSGGGGGGRESATKGLSDSWKQLLRKAYRLLLEEGQDLFDFTKSYSATVNRAAAEVIISRAVAMGNKSTPDVRSWKNLFMRYLEQWYRKTLKPTHSKSASRAQMSMDKKLSQRQRSLDSLAAQQQQEQRLEPGLRARMEALLSRDYVSSDEEEPDGCLYVKLLPWETAEAARLKAALDRHYADALAGDKERQELARVRRHPGYVSSRPPPDNPLDWAVGAAGGGGDVEGQSPPLL